MKIISFADLTIEEKEKIKRMANKLVYKAQKENKELTEEEKEKVIESAKQICLAVYNRVDNIEDVIYSQEVK